MVVPRPKLGTPPYPLPKPLPLEAGLDGIPKLASCIPFTLSVVSSSFSHQHPHIFFLSSSNYFLFFLLISYNSKFGQLKRNGLDLIVCSNYSLTEKLRSWLFWFLFLFFFSPEREVWEKNEIQICNFTDIIFLFG